MRDKITNLCGRLLETEEADAVQPIAAELQQAIHDRIETVRHDFLDVVLIDWIVEVEGFSETHKDETRN